MKSILGKTMLEHVWRRASLVSEICEIFITSSDKEILDLSRSIGANTIESGSEHENGTSRVAEFSKKNSFDKYVILQADELLVEPENINNLIIKLKSREIKFVNAISAIEETSELQDLDVVKCKINTSNKIIDMSRYYKEQKQIEQQFKYTYKICGLFGIERDLLNKMQSKNQTIISKTESIEQMQILEMGLELDSLFCLRNYSSVNTIEEWDKCLEALEKDEIQRKILNRYLQ